MLTKRGNVDLILIDGERLRAKIGGGDCRSLDYYSGFYIRPGRDGQVCADRDALRVRSGATCQIESFKTLTPKK
jgi:hypothetical protein